MPPQQRPVLVSRVLSPFQVELGHALRARGADYHIVFSNGGVGTRPSHWKMSALPDWVHVVDVESRPHLLWQLLDSLAPTSVIYGGVRGFPLPVAVTWCRARSVPLLFWLEQMSPAATLREVVRDQVGAAVLSFADAILCVGHRAMEQYSRLARERTRLHLLPYGQDLSANFGHNRTYSKDGPVTFLFSGKYLQRNNIWELLLSMRRIRQRVGQDVRFLLSGYAGAEREVTHVVTTDEVLRGTVSFETEFGTWKDRMRPFIEADVLVMPGLHSGWGLVIPEAMALGMPVISSTGIEAARYLLRDGIDGFLVAPSATWVEEAMLRFIEDRKSIETMGCAARQRARVVTSEGVADLLFDILALMS